MRYRDLVEAYGQLRSSGADSLFVNGVPEKVVSILETQRIRVLLLRLVDNPDKIKLEVEVTVPEQLQEFNDSLPSDEPESSDQSDLCNALEVTVILYQYLIQLRQTGFFLEFFREEGVWIASFELEIVPTKGFFSQIKPPMG